MDVGMKFMMSCENGVLVDRNIPRESKTLWQRLVLQLLSHDQSRTDVYPIASDLIFILPKLSPFASPGERESQGQIAPNTRVPAPSLPGRMALFNSQDSGNGHPAF